MTASVHAARGRAEPTAVDRTAAGFLVVLMAVGSLALWVGIPAAWLWLAGKVTSQTTHHFLLSILGAPLAIIAWARFLFWLNRLHARVTGAFEPEPEEEDPDERRWARGPLEPLLVGSLLIALGAMLVWFFGFAGYPGPGFW